MKKIIIILGCVILGCKIYSMILGSDDDSIKSLQEKFFEHEIESYQESY